ncbi:MAG: DUF3798 domain-containing protein [Lutispora sp.]|nr:DUF3798 domain-containing protein [Lutispora sp.]
MKKVTVILLVMALLFNLTACSKPASEPTGGEVKTEGKVAIITNTVSATEEEYRSAEDMVKKYGDRVVHVTWPENAAKEQEQMITVLTKLGADKDIKAVVINQAMPGTNAAVDKLREMRDDILVMYCNFSENPPDVAKRADVGLLGDNMRVGAVYPDQAQKLGAKTIVYYSFPRHLSLSIFSVNRDLMKKRSEELGIKFVEATAPDPTGDAGIPGTQQFILEDVPKKVAEYGPDTAFYATNCAMQIPMIQKAVELKAIYALPCCPSPFHGYPIALGIDLPPEKKGDIKYVVDATREKLREAGVLGRFSNFPVPAAYMLTVTGVEYSLKWLDGETDGKFDQKVIEEIMENFSGVKMSFRKMEDAGKTYDNVILYLQSFITY